MATERQNKLDSTYCTKSDAKRDSQFGLIARSEPKGLLASDYSRLAQRLTNPVAETGSKPVPDYEVELRIRQFNDWFALGKERSGLTAERNRDRQEVRAGNAATEHMDRLESRSSLLPSPRLVPREETQNRRSGS